MTLQKVQTEIEPNLHGEGLRIGVVMARFNQQIGEGLLSGCRAELQRLNVGHVTLTTPMRKPSPRRFGSISD